MKPVNKTLYERVTGVTVYEEDLSHIHHLVEAHLGAISVETENFEYESFDDFNQEQPDILLKKLEIRSVNPGFSISFEPNGVAIYTKSTEYMHIHTQITEYLKEKQRYLNKIPLFPIGFLIIVLYVIALYSILSLTNSTWLAVLLVLIGALVGCGVPGLFGLRTDNSIIWPKRRRGSVTVWQANMIAVLVAVGGAFATIAAAIIQVMWSR